MSKLRFHVKPGDVPPSVAARRLGMTLSEFERKLPELLSRRPAFPAADPTTGNYDLDAIDAWRKARHPGLLGDPAPQQAPSTLTRDRLRLMGGGR
jgi:hypothetical protein